MSSANITKRCPKCHREHNTRSFARHVRTCKPKKPKETLCTYCIKSFRNDNFKRHTIICKKSHTNLSRLQLVNNLETIRNENRTLHDRHIVLAMQLCKEKDDKLALRDQLCREKDDKLALRAQLSLTRDRMARRELEFTKQLAIRAKPAAVHNHHYHQYAVHMTPWCIDPTDPSYERFLADDVLEMQEAMASLPPRSISDGYRDEYQAQADTRTRQTVFSKLVRKRLGDDSPRYIVPDTSRHKGMFLMPDGTVRVDPGLSMMLQHQFMVGLGTANHACDWWFHEPLLRKQFQHMITSSAGNGAVRLKQLGIAPAPPPPVEESGRRRPLRIAIHH